jgi:hypothetical protein
MIIENFVQLSKTPLKKVDIAKLHPIIKELAGYLKISPEYITCQNTPSGGF